MYVAVVFDIVTRTVFIPNGFVITVKQLQEEFLSWMKEQPECMTAKRNGEGYCFDENTFLKYLNEVVLANSTERAYFVDNIKNGGKRMAIMRF